MRRANQKLSSPYDTVSRWILPAIIALFVLVAGIYIWQTPHFEGPDERQHFAYIEWLATGKGFPPQGDAAFETPVEQEAGQSPFYYLLASIPARLVGLTNPPIIYRENPHAFSRVGPPAFPDNDNRAIHYPGDGQPLTGGWLALYLARFLSLTFGIILLISTYGLTREVFPEIPQLAWMTTLLVAVNPQVLFISSVASNDIPAAALSGVTLWLLAIFLRRGPTNWRAAGLGLAFGLALLTKTSGMALALPIAIALGWLWLSGRQSFSNTLRYGILILLGVLLIAGWWFARSWMLYDSPLGLGTHDRTAWAIGKPGAKLLTPYARWQDVFRSFWVSFGWGTIRARVWLYNILFALSAIAGLGLIMAAWRWLRRPNHKITVTIILLALLTLSIIAVAFALELWMRRVVASYGRLMFPALTAIAVLMVTGWYSLHSKLPYMATGVIALIALTAPFWLLKPAFAMPTPLDEAEIAELEPAIGWRFGPSVDEPVAELISVRPLEESREAGSMMMVEVCWLVLAQSERPYSVLIHVIGPENQLITNRRTYPGLGHYPTTIWQPGDVFCDTVRLIVWENVPATLVYKIEVAMLDLEENMRIPIYDALGNPVEVAFAGDILIFAKDSQVPFTTSQENGEAAQIVDYQLPEEWHVGQDHHLTLQWGVLSSMSQDYQVFAHLRDPETKKNVAQADGPPLDGWYPTSRWPAGEIITDNRSFPLPEETPPGTYELYVGLYDLASGVRFGSEYLLGSVEVQP